MQRHPLMWVSAELGFAPVVWFTHLSGLYLVATLFCLDRWRDTQLYGLPILGVSIALLTLFAAGLIVLALLWQRRRTRYNAEQQMLAPRFRSIVPPLLAVLSLTAIIWQAGVAMQAQGCSDVSSLHCIWSISTNIIRMEGRQHRVYASSTPARSIARR